jgi:hypothetical protein
MVYKYFSLNILVIARCKRLVAAALVYREEKEDNNSNIFSSCFLFGKQSIN